MNPPPDALVCCLGWTLVHFLWQGICIAAWLKVCLWLLRRSSANQRYLAGCAALAAMAIAPVITFNHLTRQQATLGPTAPVAMALANPAANEISTIPSGPASIVSLRHEPPAKIVGRQFDGALPWLVVAWAAGVIALSVRLLAGWWHVERLKRRATADLGGYWNERLAELARRLRMSRTIRLVQSALVEVPTVIGWLRPIILLPAGCMAGLSPAQLEAVLAHELAHIRRHDFFVNLLQNALETLLFYHPAVWWVSRCVRREREHCCDDLALRVCGDRMTYARALATLEEWRPEPAQLAIAASGAPLLERIRRLAGRPDKEVGRSGWLAVAIFTTMVAIVLTFSFRENRAVAREQNPPADSTTNAANPVLAAWRTAALLSEAERLFDAGDLDGAESKFKQVPADDPKAPRAAVFLEKIKQAREARSFYSFDRIATQVNGMTQTLVRTDTNEWVLQTGRAYIDKARQNILSKLAGIRIDKVEYENWPLEDVLNDLNERSGSLDPDRMGINFLINRGLEPPRGEGTEVVDISREITVTIKPALSNICLADVLDVITNVANKPADVPGILRYSIGDFAVIFSLSTNESAQTLTADPTIAERDFIEATREELIGPNSPSQSGGGASPSPGLAALFPATSDEYNRVLEYGRSLGERRAIEARLAWLRAGIDPSRVNVLSTNPVNPGKKESVTIGNSVITADHIELNTNAGTITATGSAQIVTSQVTKTNPMTRAEFSPDGRRIVTTRADGSLRVWDAQTGKALGTVSSNSALPGLKTTASNEPARIWDARTGKAIEFASVNGASTNDSKGGRLVAPEMKASDSPTNSIPASTLDTSATGTRPPMVTRVFRIDPNSFKEGLKSAASALAREGKPSNSDASQLARVVTTTNDASLLRAVLVANGIDLNPANPLNAGKTLFYNERKGTVMVHSTAADLNRVASVLQTLNTSPPQIQIKAVFVEVDDVSNQFAGLSIFVKSGRFETSLTNQPVSDLERFFQNREHPITNSILMQYTGTMTRAQAAEFMHKLEQQNGVDVLTTHVVTTKSGLQAQIQISEVHSVVTGVNPGGVGTNRYIVQSFPFGPTLDVIPQIAEDGRHIQMEVIPTVTEFIGYDDPGKVVATTNGTVLPLPHFRLRTLVANASVEDGETLVLGGVAAESTTQLKDKIPVLGDIPVLGHLFRSSSTVKSRKNLLVFVTPTLVNPDGTPFHPGKTTGEK
jgi:beta-lactamase regulating signal transducer with metallopeptidase domain/Flp pilus assembly secretin CpaC